MLIGLAIVLLCWMFAIAGIAGAIHIAERRQFSRIQSEFNELCASSPICRNCDMARMIHDPHTMRCPDRA